MSLYSFFLNPAGFDAGSAYGSNNVANPVSAGSSWEEPSYGFTDSGARAAAAAAKTRPQTASRKAPKYSQPGVQNKPVAADDTYPAPDRARVSQQLLCRPSAATSPYTR